MSGSAVAIIGAGNVGCALAADLTLRGAEVHLFNRSADRLEAIREAGGITATGEIDGFAPLEVTTQSLAEAVDGCDVVAVTVPTATLPSYASALADAVTDEQILWLDPGHSGGALYLSTAFGRSRGTRVCQTTTASHVSRMIGPAAVRVFLLARAAVASLPSRHLAECHERLDALLPGQFGKAETVLEADLANINALMHPPGMICNAGWIEATAGRFGFYADGAGGAVAAVIDAIDRERLALATGLGVPAAPFGELFHRLGFSGETPVGAAAYEALRASELIHPIQAPRTLDHRYLHEDIGWGLVPWMHLADTVGTPAPTITALVQLASVINGVDYATEGLTLERMGLAGKSVAEIRAHVGAATAAETAST